LVVIAERDMAGKLIGDPGVGAGERTTDHDLAGLGQVELATGLVPLAEEIADEPLGTLIQGLEVRRELGVDVPAKIKN